MHSPNVPPRSCRGLKGSQHFAQGLGSPCSRLNVRSFGFWGVSHIHHGACVYQHGVHETVQRDIIPIVLLHLPLQGDTQQVTDFMIGLGLEKVTGISN